jgi:uncharacterized protein (DUF2336 family)
VIMVPDIERPASPSPSNIVRRFLSWAQRADASGRSEAASALARAYLYSDLSAALRREVEIALASLLDDHSALVRRALAEALASAYDAPHHIVLALACDQSEVSCAVLARSPILTDADLVDCVAIGDVRAQIAVARRPRLSVAVAAALAEIGEREAAIALAGNLEAAVSPAILSRIFERFGEDACIREALVMRPALPPTLRCELVDAAARALSAFVAEREWLGADRAGRIAREAAEQGVVTVASSSKDDEIQQLVRHFRQQGSLTIALLLRALLSGNRALVEGGFAELSGLSRPRTAGLVREPRSAGFAALYAKTSLPAQFLPVFRAALAALAEGRVASGDQLSWALTERAIEACEKANAPGLDKLMSLLRRFEAEAAREEARLYAAESASRREAPLVFVRLDAIPLRESAPAIAPPLSSLEAGPADDAATSEVYVLDGIVALADAA